DNWKPDFDIDPEWKKVKIGDIAELATGGTPLSTNKNYYGGDIKWLVSGDIHKKEIYDCDGRITELALKESNAKLLPINSVLIALNGQGKTRGSVAILRTTAACNQSLISINPDNQKMLPEFLFYVLESKYKDIRSITGDNQRSGLNMSIIRSIEVPMPTIAAQKIVIEEVKKEKNLVDVVEKLININKSKIAHVVDKIWNE
ncbi:MAG: restriction endonuclease subunit S, partial [Bacteroidales bacterium]|nr:restriction endonuclease subunit S [Bacteroidales bacterium]